LISAGGSAFVTAFTHGQRRRYVHLQLAHNDVYVERKILAIGEAARSYSSIELEAVRVGGAAWRFPGILQKGIEDAILFVTTRSYCGLAYAEGLIQRLTN
jgi:hypothetical protein